MHIFKPKSKTILTKRINLNVPSRTMTRFSGLTTRLIPPARHVTISKRTYPDQGFKGFKVKSTVSGKDPKTGHNNYETNVVDANGQQLPQHEKAHYLVRDNETGKDVALLTSAKNPAKGNEYLAPENVKSDLLPNGQPKPQMIRSLSKPRFSVDNPEIVEDPEASAFLKKYETETNNFVKNAGVYKKIPIYRTTKDSPNLYHVDGRPIYDKDGKEIDYDI